MLQTSLDEQRGEWKGRSNDCRARKQNVIVIGVELARFQDGKGSRGAGKMT